MKNVIIIIFSFCIFISFCFASNNNIITNPYPDLITIQDGGRRITLHPQEQDVWVNSLTNRVTAAIEWSFANLVKGGVIHVSPGTYRISRTIQALGFQGTIRGSRAQQSIFMATGVPSAPESSNYVFPMLSEADRARIFLPQAPPLFFFGEDPNDHRSWRLKSTDLTVEDMHYRAADIPNAAEFIIAGKVSGLALFTYNFISGPVPQFNISDPEDLVLSHVEVTFRRCTFIGGGRSFTYGSNVGAFVTMVCSEIWIPVPSDTVWNGYEEISHLPCNFVEKLVDNYAENNLLEAFAIEFPYSVPTGRALLTPMTFDPTLPKSRALVKRNHLKNIGRGAGNTGLPTFGLFVIAPSGAEVVIKENTMEDMPNYGIAILSGRTAYMSQPYFEQDPAEIIIEDNNLEMIQSSFDTNGAAILVEDWYAEFGERAAQVSIKNNRLYGSANYTGALMLLPAATYCELEANRFSGNAANAIVLAADSPLPVRASYIRIERNNVKHLVSSSTPIILSAQTNNCTVIGQKAQDVQNLGTNNVIVPL